MPDDLSRLLALDLIRRHPETAARELEQQPADVLAEFLSGQPDNTVASLIEALRPEVVVGIIEQFEPSRLGSWLSLTNPVQTAIVVSRLDERLRQQVLAGVEPRVAREVTEIMSYPPETAGTIMDPRVSHFRADASVGDALLQLRGLRHLRIANIHVVTEQARYIGSIRLQDLVVAEPDQELRGLITSLPVSVRAMAPRVEVLELLEQHRLATVPVVDYDGRLVGVIRQDALMTAVEAEATADMQAMVGASRDESALSPVPFAVRKRLPWLQINLLTAFLASFVVGLFEQTIAQVTALAVLLPVVAGQSGNTGAQALAVTMRGLALREIRVRSHAFRVALKESLVAALNGAAVALVTALAVFLWSRSAGMAAVIGVAMVVSMIIAGLAGAVIPMLLTMLGQDPAQASSIVLTTVTDVAGFLSFLGLATLFLNFL